MTRCHSLWIFAGVLLGAAPLWAVDPPTVEAPLNSCVTAECHADVKDHAVLHGPVNVDGCDACHTLTDPATHRYELARPANELCRFCHQVDWSGAPVVHEPMNTGDCMGCHDPHGGFDRASLRSESMGELCATCHGDLTAGKASVHGPVAAGACNACHTPHVSQHEGLLTVPADRLCESCHAEMTAQLQRVQFVHEPVKEGECVACHDAHASDHIMMIRSDPLTLCTESCHADVKRAVLDAPFKHSAVTQDNACVNCHTAHGSDLAGLMNDQPINICMHCHDRAVTTPDGQTVRPVTEILAPDLVKHGPVADGSCGGCHNVHGSDVSRLLVKPYPATFYAPFEVENYDLCFTCHEPQRVLDREGRGLTQFRDGDVNLHFVHVNKAERGRSCRACHETHASPNDLHIRKSVPYGNWELPINFTRTDTGGSCAPGCHQALAYDRDNPVQPSDQPPLPPLNADLELQTAPAGDDPS